MPIDADVTELATEPSPKPQPPSDPYKGMRLGLAVATIFVIGMALAWPFAFLSAVFASLFLQGPMPPPGRVGVGLVGLAFALLFAAYVLFSIVLPYRAVMMIAMAMFVVWAFSLSVSGKNPLIVVLALMAALMMPYLATLSLDIAQTMTIWLPVNLGLALLTTWAAFAVFPPEKYAERRAEQAAQAAPKFDPGRRLVRMTLVTLPFVMVFFMIEAGAVLTLLFVAILSQQLAASTGAGSTVAKGMLLANVAGGLVAILAYELVVVSTTYGFMVVISLLMCLAFAGWFASDRPNAALAGSALTTALILFGGAMAPFGEDVDVKMLDRIFQVGAALVWVLTAFVVVDHFLPEREEKPDLPSWKKKPQRGRGRRSRRPEPPA